MSTVELDCGHKTEHDTASIKKWQWFIGRTGMACPRCDRPALDCHGEPDYSAICQQAQEAFWKVIADAIPTRTSDLGPEDAIEFDAACRKAMFIWLRWSGGR